ncbi:FAD-binding dehydrogenase [Mariniluteicoccus endophyticus]
MDADVIVIGSGLSGLVAATTAAGRGLSVIVLDAEGPQSVGGQAHWSFGGLFLVDSPEQRRLGVRDSRELALADWLGSAGFDRDEDVWGRRWAEAYVDFAAGEKRAWLSKKGVRFFPLVQWAERGGHLSPGHGNSVPRFHITWGTGPGLVQPFATEARESRLVDLRFRHYVDHLEVSNSGVSVSGRTLAPDHAERGRPTNRDAVGEFTVAAPNVVIASGGIGGNLDLVRELWPAAYGSLPPRDDLVQGVPDYVDGSMLGVGEAAGGHIVNRDRMWHYPEGIRNHSPLWSQHGVRILPAPSSLWLDADGHRLPAPNFPGFDALGTLREISARGHAYSWFVLDEETIAKEFALSGSEQNADLTGRDVRLLSQRLRPGPTKEVQAFVDAGIDIVVADTVAELAGRMNGLVGTDRIDADALLATISERDGQVASGLGKDPQVVATRAARSYAVDRLMRVVPPHRLTQADGSGRHGSGGRLIAARLHVLTRKTLGGFWTDLDARVLDAAGDPVPGLYAVGEAAGFGGGGVHGWRALEGTFLGGCLHSGLRAGRAL